MRNFDFKKFLTLNDEFGKQLVTIVYYAVSALIAFNLVTSFIAGIGEIAMGAVLSGAGKIVYCLPLSIVYFLLLRLACELVNAILEHCGKN